jgi:phosphate:Na+ symporter
MILAFLTFLGSLGLFLFGMKVMSEALQKLSGERLRGMMRAMTVNRFTGLLSGLLVTSLVQSSSATTVMIVSFVNAGLLNLFESIGMIMGANLGTTTTFWIISFLGFKFSLSGIALPIIGVGFPMMFLRNAKIRDSGEFLVGFGLLFFGLLMLKDSVPDIAKSPDLLQFVQSFTGKGVFSVLFFFAFGTVLTILVQSSSVAGAITLTLAYKGWIDYPSSAAIILGENVGTTITANIAAITGNTAARRAAFAHFLFNILGVIWAILLFAPFAELIDWLIPGDTASPDALPLHLAGFHTAFNLVNIALMIGFVPQLVRLVEGAIRGRAEGPATHVSLRRGSLPQTAELSLAEAEREVQTLTTHARELVDGFIDVFGRPEAETSARIDSLRQLEETSDEIALDVTQYLVRCSSAGLSEASMTRVSALLRVIAELEDMCDCGNRLIQLSSRRVRKGHELPEETLEQLREYGRLLAEFLSFLAACLPRGVQAQDMEVALEMEARIDAARKRLRKESVTRMLASGETIKAEVLYMDVLNNMRRVGKHAMNILEALRLGA